MKQFVPAPFLLLVMSFTGCSSNDSLPPTVAIVSPASGSPVAAVTSVQVSAADDRGVRVVELFARGKGGTERGVLVGTAVEEPYVVSWQTTSQPNFAELELLAVARDLAGNEAESSPITVRTQNGGVPSLERLYAFTVPVPTGTAGLALEAPAISEFAPVTEALPPTLSSADEVAASSDLSRLDSHNRSYALEWQLTSFSGADGYGLYYGDSDLAGPYELLGRFSAVATGGSQNYSAYLDEAGAGDSYVALATAVTGGPLLNRASPMPTVLPSCRGSRLPARPTVQQLPRAARH
jgi:hypothetical protein